MGVPLWAPPFTISPDGSARGDANARFMSDLVCYSHDPTQIDVFWIGPNGSIQSVWWNAKPNKWSPPSVVAPAGTARADSPLVVLSRAKAHMDLFWIGTDGAIHSMAWSLPGNKWTAPAAITPAGAARAASSLAASSREANSMHVFWIATNGAVETVGWTQAAKWDKPAAITPANAARGGSTLATTPRTASEVHVFYVGADDAVHSVFWTKQQNKWVPPFPVTGTKIVGSGSHLACLARTPDHIEVFWVNYHGAVFTTWADRKFDKGKWITPVAVTPEKSAFLNSPLVALARVTDHVDLFWLSDTKAVMSSFWTKIGNKDQWSGPFATAAPGSARNDSGLSVIARIPSHVDVFWFNAKGAVSSNWWDENSAPEVYVSWDNPFIASQYGNTYHQSAPEHFEFSYTGGGGNHAEANYVLSKTRLHSVTGFKPSTHGFHFSNSDWKRLNIKLPVVEIDIPKPIGRKIDISNTSQGMCGGMTYAVIDYFMAKQKIPTTTDPPSKENDPLFQYLKHRLESSWDITRSGINYVKLMDPAYPDGDEGVVQAVGAMAGRSFVVAVEEWPKIKADIDANKLCPLGLVQVRSLNPIDVGKNHQVIAYAYELSANNVTLHLYDPNEPLDDTVQLKFNISSWAGRIDIHRFVKGKAAPTAINSLFRTNYATPPASLKRP
jgi:hypothetical protein